jgi:hypothetical protein
MKIYSVSHWSWEGPKFFSNLAKAKACAIEARQGDDVDNRFDLDVGQDETGHINREKVVALLSGCGWSEANKVVFTAKAKP